MMVIVPRIAVVSCFSTTPFIYGIQHEDNLRAGLLLSDPAETIQAFSEHKADIALIPAAAMPSLTDARIVSNTVTRRFSNRLSRPIPGAPTRNSHISTTSSTIRKTKR